MEKSFVHGFALRRKVRRDRSLTGRVRLAQLVSFAFRDLERAAARWRVTDAEKILPVVRRKTPSQERRLKRRRIARRMVDALESGFGGLAPAMPPEVAAAYKRPLLRAAEKLYEAEVDVRVDVSPAGIRKFVRSDANKLSASANPLYISRTGRKVSVLELAAAAASSEPVPRQRIVELSPMEQRRTGRYDKVVTDFLYFDLE